jgi:hypothetical protein
MAGLKLLAEILPRVVFDGDGQVDPVLVVLLDGLDGGSAPLEEQVESISSATRP